MSEPTFIYGSAEQPTFEDITITAAGHAGNGCARIIGTQYGKPSNIVEKTVTLIGIDEDGVQHELYTTNILHNLYKKDLPSSIID